MNQSTNRFYLHRRVILPVAVRALVLLAALLFEDDDLVAATVVNDCRLNARALDSGRADLHAVVAADDEGFEFDCLARLLVERRHANGCALFDAKLFAAGTDDCVSHKFLTPSTRARSPTPEKSFIIKTIPPPVKPSQRVRFKPLPTRPSRRCALFDARKIAP